MCDCFQVGGRFIAEDPDCPVHGTDAKEDAEEQETRIQDLEARVVSLEYQLKRLSTSLL